MHKASNFLERVFLRLSGVQRTRKIILRRNAFDTMRCVEVLD
jgi:hypothetical protein